MGGASLGWVLEPWGRQFLAQPSKVLSTGASRARVTPVEGERDKPTLVEARHLGGRNLTGRRGFSCQQAKVAPATMEGEGGKLLARMSLAQGSLAASLVDNNNTVAVAASTVSPSTTITTGSTATSRTRDSTTRTRTPGGASATTV